MKLNMMRSSSLSEVTRDILEELGTWTPPSLGGMSHPLLPLS